MKTLAAGIIIVSVAVGLGFILGAPLYKKVGNFASKLLKPFKEDK